MTKLQGSWIWYDLISPDPAGSKAFYEAVIGWSISTGHGADSDYGFIANPDGTMTGGLMRLSAELQAQGTPPSWIGYVGADDVDASVAEVVAAGGQCLMPPRDIPMAGRVTLVSDCGGAQFYLMTPAPPPGGGESTAFSALPNPGKCGWNELYAADLDQAAAFYTGLFGWTLPAVMDMGPMGKYQFIAHDGVQIGAMMNKPEPVPAPVWCHYFWTDGISAAIARITSAGGQIAGGPHEVPGPLWTVQAIDPQGTLFSLVGGP